MSNKVIVEGGFRLPAEAEEASTNRECFEKNPDPWEKKLESFPKYVRRQNLTRFLALYEIFKQVLDVKGSVIECGVHRGFGLMTWLKLSAILEPVNLTRRIYGFDSFAGFPAVSDKDTPSMQANVRTGDLFSDSKKELETLIDAHDKTRFLGHLWKAKLIQGDAVRTIPSFIEENPHLLVSLLFLDFDLYEPTKAALSSFLPRMPKGAVIAFDELDNPLWPGETQAMLEVCGAGRLRIQRLPFDPYIGFAVIE